MMCPQTTSTRLARPNALILFCPYMNIEERAGELGLTTGKARSLSPDRHIHRSTPPMFVVVGERDKIVGTVRQAIRTVKRQGGHAELVTVPNVGHGLKLLWTKTVQEQLDVFLASLGYIPESSPITNKRSF